MRTRAERRALTERYQKKQARIHKEYYGPYEDPDRRGQEDTPYHGRDGYSYSPASGWWHETPPKAKTLGQWRQRSVFDCGKSRCQFCCSPRYSYYGTKRGRLTLQEQRHEDSFLDQMRFLDSCVDCCD